MKLSRMLNEETIGYAGYPRGYPDWIDHVKATPYSDRDHWAAYKFDIPGPIDIVMDADSLDAYGQITIEQLAGIAKIRNIVITPNFDALPDGHSMLPTPDYDNPLDNIKDEFEGDKEWEATPYQIEGYWQGRPFYGEFEYIEWAQENTAHIPSTLDGAAEDAVVEPRVINMTGVFDNIIDKIAWPILNKHYETHR